MDPLMFAIDDSLILEVLGTVVLLSLFIERGLSIVFESRLYLKHVELRANKKITDKENEDWGEGAARETNGWRIKEYIAFATSYAVVYTYESSYRELNFLFS